MYQLIISQGRIMLYFIILGVLMAVSYDVLRCVRIFKIHRTVSIGIQDFIYWVIWTYFLIYAVLKYNNGNLRFFIYMSIIIGVIVYELTVSRLVLVIIRFIAGRIKKISISLNKLLKKIIGNIKIKM